MSWPKTVKQIFRDSHEAGVLDLLHAVLNKFEEEPDHHACQTREWAERLYRDPELLKAFVHDCQRRREA